MARRMIECKTWKSYQVGQLDYRQRCLWIGLITAADDQGRGRAHPGVVRGAVFPYDEIEHSEIQADLDRLAELQLVHLYPKNDGAPLYQIVNWWRYQRPTWAWPSDLPAPDGWSDREKYRQGNEVVQNGWDDDGGFITGPSDPIVTSQRPHDDPTVSKAPSTSGSTSTSDRESGSDDSANARPPAVTAFRENAHRFPPKSWWSDVDEVVGRDPPDVERWGQTVKAYVGQGWNPINVDNMLTFYREKRIPGDSAKADSGIYSSIDFGD